MMIQIVEYRPNTTPVGHDRRTLTFKAMLYLCSCSHASLLTVLCGVYHTVQLGYPTITNIFVINQLIRYNGMFSIRKTPL